MKAIFFILTAIILLDSCGSWSATDIHTPDWEAFSQQRATQKALSNHIRLKLGGDLVKTSGFTIRPSLKGLGKASGTGLNSITNTHGNKQLVLINLRSIKPGAYLLSAVPDLPDSYGDHTPNYTGDLFYSYSFVSGAFNLKEIKRK